MRTTSRLQPLLIRITHWINVPVIAVLGMSGLEILRAYPYFGPRGATYDWMPLAGWDSPVWLRAGHWLAGARHVHFALMWSFAANALIYVGYVVATREYRRRWIRLPHDIALAFRQLFYYLDSARYHLARIVRRSRARRWIEAPPAGLYNALQRVSYTAVLGIGIVEVLSGLAIWKPVQLHWLAWLMGGYDVARVIHFLGLLALFGFAVVHVAMVALHWRRFPEMITGGRVQAEATEPVAVVPATGASRA
jgi:thiosulfate reductase cytochrome b subunit